MLQDADANTVVASLHYLASTETDPKTYMAKLAPGAKSRRPAQETYDIPVYDSRPLLDTLSLDVQGFALTRHRSQVENFYDEAEVKRVYYPEVERLMKQATGAARVIVFDHNVRNVPRADAGTGGARQPVWYVHNDYTEKSGPQRLREIVGEEEADALLAGRFAFVNAWRPIRGPVQDAPLGICDAQTMVDADFAATDLVYEDRVGEIYSFRHNPAHRWYYVPDMQADEVILLKCYDSDRSVRARFTAHSAFRNPASPADAIPRESIEARTIVIYPGEG